MVIAENTQGVGRLLESLRKIKNIWTQPREAGASLDVIFASVNRWDTDHRKPTPLVSQQIEQLFGTLREDSQQVMQEFIHLNGVHEK